MNYKPFVLIALALCLCVSFPANAVWDNGNWVADDANVGYRVVHGSVSEVDSKYRDVPQTIEGRSPGDMVQGILRGSIRAGYNTLTREVGIRNDDNPLGANGTFKFFPINPDATFEIALIPGNFTLFLKDGNGGQPEYSHARITANEISYPNVELKGHAISARPDPKDATIDAGFGCGDITFGEIKFFSHQVKTRWGFKTVIDYIETTVNINRFHADVTNPNYYPVDVAYTIDFHYSIDTNPNDGSYEHPQIVSTTDTYNGLFTDVGQGTTSKVVTLIPKIEAVQFTLDGFDLDYYPVTLSPPVVTSTTWS